MRTRHLAAVSLAVALLGVSGLSAAAGTPQSAMHDRGSSMMGGGMMGGEMMRNCPMMGQLPPGNEKLAMQMHGEMATSCSSTPTRFRPQPRNDT